MNREELLEHLCPSKNRERCRNENISCNECDIVINTYLDEYDKHVIEQYEANRGIADTIKDIHDCVAREMYRRGIDDLKCCLIMNSRTESINGKEHLIITEDSVNLITDLLKGQKNEEI